jgi:hypothetical protein
MTRIRRKKLIFQRWQEKVNSENDRNSEGLNVNHIIYFIETVTKTLRSERIRKSPELHFSTPSPPEVKVPSKDSTTISHSNETKWQNDGSINISPLENRILQLQDLRGTAKRENLPSTTQHLRSRREIDAISESKVGPTECSNFTFTIKYEDEYKVWNNFSMLYQSHTYYFYMYRVTDDGLQVCNSSDTLVQQRWWNFIVSEKRMMASQYCNAFVDGFYVTNYTLLKNFTVFFHPTEQSFTRQDYGVMFGHFAICSAKLSLSCNDDLIKVKYDEQYNVFKNFSLVYNNTMYDYREYRFSHDSLEMCASIDSRVQALWRTRNSWEKFKEVYKCYRYYYLLYYIVTKQFTAYSAYNSQYFTRNDYAVIDGKLYICREKFKLQSTQYTQEDLLMCNDSIINIKYDDEYRVWENFSILCKNKVYDYTEYRVLDDSVKICNSTDNDARNIWKERNKYVKEWMHYKSCNKLTYVEYYRGYYTVLKDFKVLILETRQVITKYDYGVVEGKFRICDEKLIGAFFLQPLSLADIPSLCAVVLSIICLLLLLIVYCMLPELRTLPGLNLMSLSFAFLLWLAYNVVYVTLYRRVGTVSKFPCARLVITAKFLTYSILMNAAVNIYVLRKTFCGNILLKSDVNKWKTFLKYSVFSWGVPVIITIVYIVLVKKDVLKLYHHIIYGCVFGNIPDWLAIMKEYGLPCCLLLYNIVMFIFTAYRIRQKLKASSSIAQKSNMVKTRKSFVLLLKLSTTVAITWLPVIFDRYIYFNVHFYIYMSI